MEQTFDFLKKIERRPGNLIQGLQLIQAEKGYISAEGIRAAAEYFERPPADVEGAVSFYTQFKRVRPGKFRIAVCDGSVCRHKGGAQLRERLQQELGIAPGETTEDGRFSLETVPCLGSCSQAPVLSINGDIYAKADHWKLKKILQECAEK